MLFKEEAPPPRYALNDDITDNEFITETTYDLQIDVREVYGKPFLLLAPRCTALSTEFVGTSLGTIKLISATKPKSSTDTLAAIAPDFYEVETHPDEFTSSHHWNIPVRKGPQGTIILALPALNEPEAAFLGRELVLRLSPSKIILATPGLSFMDSEVCYLSTTQYPTEEIFGDIQPAEPPVIVQGTGAAAVSRAEQCGIPAIALVVSADGPANHEIIRESGMIQLRAALFQTLQLKLVSGTQVENSLSVLYV